MEVIVVPAAQDVAMAAAGIISRLVAGKPGAVLGLATGASVKRVYAELALAHHNHPLDFSRVTTFNLDEYVGLSRSHPASFHAFSGRTLSEPRERRPSARAPAAHGGSRSGRFM
jgi:glucosamine-6-phosphate deaminase